jgi:hypothetical protein
MSVTANVLIATISLLECCPRQDKNWRLHSFPIGGTVPLRIVVFGSPWMLALRQILVFAKVRFGVGQMRAESGNGDGKREVS